MFNKCTTSFLLKRFLIPCIGLGLLGLDTQLLVNRYGTCPVQMAQYMTAVINAMPFIISSPFILLTVHLLISQFEKIVVRRGTPESASFFKILPRMNMKIRGQLQSLGITSIDRLAEENPREIATILDCRIQVANEWVNLARIKCGLPPLERILHPDKLPEMKLRACKILRRFGVSSLLDLAAEDAEEVSEILGCPIEEIQVWISFARKVLIESMTINPEACAPYAMDQNDLARENELSENLSKV